MPLRALRYSSLFGIADDLAFERFDGILRVVNKLADDTDCGRLIFDLNGDLAAHGYTTFGRSGRRAPQISFRLIAYLRGQLAVDKSLPR